MNGYQIGARGQDVAHLKFDSFSEQTCVREFYK